MARRYWTSDFHLGMESILQFENRPFKTIEKHDAALLRSCCQHAKDDDTIIHVGDLFCYKQDSHAEKQGLSSNGSDKKPIELIDIIPATFVNIRGNHDLNNKVKSLCDSLRTKLSSRYLSVSVSHYPSYDPHAIGHFLSGDIHICGHVHGKWRHCLDLDNQVLNINVGVDVWNYSIISEDELIKYIDSILKLSKDKITKVKAINGKVAYV